jgi:hypothetical protein
MEVMYCENDRKEDFDFYFGRWTKRRKGGVANAWCLIWRQKLNLGPHAKGVPMNKLCVT